MANDGFVIEFTLTNCYVDTSYQNYDGTVILSKFSENEPQTEMIKEDFTIVANDGFKLNPEFTFKVQPQLGVRFNPDVEWDTITQDDFSPIDKPFIWEWDFSRGDFKYKGLDINNSLVHTKLKADGSVYYHLMLVGGFNPYKLVFVLLYPYNYGSIKYDGNGYRVMEFYYIISDSWGEVNEPISLLNNLVFTAESDKPVEPDVTENLFTTYYLDSKKLDEIRQLGTVSSEIIINTYSYPIKFPDDSIKDTTIKTGFISQVLESKTFIKNITTLDVFIFDVPDIPDVTECYIRIPFNNNVNLKYEDVRGKRIRGYISYEVLTNTTTLFITDEVETLFKNVITIGIKVPFKPTGLIEGFSEPVIRLASEAPKLFIKGMNKTVKGNYIQGKIKEPINRILKNELDILNELLNKGVFLNE